MIGSSVGSTPVAGKLILGVSMHSTGMMWRRSGSNVEASVAKASAGALSLRGILLSSKSLKLEIGRRRLGGTFP